MYIKRHSLSIGLLVSSLTLVASILSTNAHAATYYISPTGSNSNAGASSSAPWRTFSFAIPKLRPGDTLTLLDGTYSLANGNGLPSFACGTNAVNGTTSQPITMRAQNERKAHIQSDGTSPAMIIRGCSYWVIEGLYLSSTDNPTHGNIDAIVTVWDGSHHLTLRRLLVSRNNRYTNSHGITLLDTHYSLLEENELYFFHRHGITLSGYTDADVPSYNILRRNYAWGGDLLDIPGGYPGNPTDMADVGISCYPCNNTILENNIMEHWAHGYDQMALMNTINNRYLGNIAIGNRYGAGFYARSDYGNSLNGMPQNTQVTNFLVVASTRAIGLYLRSNKNTRCDNCTIIDGTGVSAIGLAADFNGTTIGDRLPTVFGTNILIANNAQSGFSLTSQSQQQFDRILVYGNGAASSPALTGPPYSNVLTVNPALGTCKVFIPAGSPAKGAGVGGADIGANILYRYQDGVLTTTPLWDPITGQFPCGAQVPGVNDIAGSSCFDVHKRLNVNTNGCTLPTSVSLLPTNLRMVGSPQ